MPFLERFPLGAPRGRLPLLWLFAVAQLCVGPPAAAVSPTPSGPEVESAVYLSPGDGRALDVTDPLKAQCLRTPGACTVSCNNQLAGDPAFGQRKYCRISYRCSGAEVQKLQIQEGQSWSIYCPSSATPSPSAPEIRNAVYLSSRNGQELDVTTQVRSLCASTPDSCTLSCNNQLAGDPDPGQQKHCKISYRCGPHPYQELEIREGERSALSCPAVGISPAPALTATRSGSEFPALPVKQLPLLKGIPRTGPFAIEVGESDIRVFDLTDHRQFRWDLPQAALSGLPPQSSLHRASWAPRAAELFFAKRDRAFLISRDGNVRPVSLQMPGHLQPFDGMETYAMSFDGQSIAYYLLTRDIGDRQPDGFGRLYVDLMVQRLNGSPPLTIMRNTRPSALAWSPDAQKIAYGTGDGQIVVLTPSGKRLLSTRAPGEALPGGLGTGIVMDLRWTPDGKKLGFLMYPAHQIYVMDENGAPRRVQIKYLANELPVNSFDWSPDGAKLVFRSPYGAPENCNRRAQGYKFETGQFPCLHGSNLFTSEADGTGVSRITADADYAVAFQGELFWVQ